MRFRFYVWMVLVPVLWGCGNHDGDHRFYILPPDPDTLVLVDQKDPATLDPALTWGFLDGKLIGYIFSNLVRFDVKANIIPDLAESWDISPDGLQYTFHLNLHARFSNGRAVTTDDVVYSFNRVLAPQTAARSAWVLERIASMKAVNRHQVVIQLNKPFTPFLNMLAMPAAAVVPQEEVEKAEASGTTFSERPVGSGPWKFDEWKHDQYVSFVRNDEYWKPEKPAMSKLVYRIISNAFTSIAEFETGNVAVIEPLPEAEVLRWKTHPQWKNYTRLEQELVLDQLLFNTEREPFNRVEVRQALSQTLEMPLLLEAVREGAGFVANGPIPNGISGHDPNRKPYPYQPDEALKVLQQHNAINREFVFLIPSNDAPLRLLGEIMQAEWKKLGIKVRLQPLEWVTYKRMMLDGDFDLCFQNWYGDYPDGDNFLYPLFHSSQIGLVNGSRLNDPDVDRLIEASQSEQDTAKRIQLLEQANALIVEKAPAIFLWYRAKYIVAQPWLKNYQVPLIFNGTQMLNAKVEIPETSDE